MWRYLSFSLRSLSSIVVARIRATSTPTIPNAPVKTVSRKVLAKEEKGPTQPTWFAAVGEFVQKLS